MTFGNRLKELAHAKYGNVDPLKQLAEDMGISSSHLSQYIGNKTEMGLSKLKILRKLGFDINYLLDEGAAPNTNLTVEEMSVEYNSRDTILDDMSKSIVAVIAHYNNNIRDKIDTDMKDLVDELVKSILWLLRFAIDLSEQNEKLNNYITLELNAKNFKHHLDLRSKMNNLIKSIEPMD